MESLAAIMALQLINANAVIAARNFNPSVISQIWLVDNEIVTRDDFQPGFVFSDMVVSFRTKRFECLVAPERLQLTPNGGLEDQQRIVVESLGRIVELLPHTPFHAAGMNFTWHMLASDEDIRALSRRLFFSNTPLYRAFDADDAQFGGYMSRDVLGCRLKLDVKPASLTQGTEKKVEMLQFAFNFHLDIGSQRRSVECIKAFLAKWDEAIGIANVTLACLQESSHDD
jgi:hypothetical protein